MYKRQVHIIKDYRPLYCDPEFYSEFKSINRDSVTYIQIPIN